jgi:hypothetical protein
MADDIRLDRIAAAAPAVAEFRSRASGRDQRRPAPGRRSAEALEQPVESAAPAGADYPPEPVIVPETIYAAAVVAGGLAPPAASPAEILLRTSRAWTPPDSELRLTDKKI